MFMNYMSGVNNKPENAINMYIYVTFIVLILMMSLGLLMRFEQGGLIDVGPIIFYQLLTAHGTGMVGIAAIAGTSVMWYFLNQEINLSTKILITNLILFVIGAGLILGSIFIGKFSAGWTFLYPLPAMPMGLWTKTAAAAFFIGLLLIGTGFLVLYYDIGLKIIREYGSFSRSLGLYYLFGKEHTVPSAAAIASTMVVVVNTTGIIGGATILLMSLINLFYPEIDIDPLLAKNMTYFFGHVFINATIYMAVIAVYEIMPKYTGSKWKVNKIFVLGWVTSTVMVLIVYPHHLLMDFSQSTALHILGQVVSYTSGLPVLLVTAYGIVANVHRTNIKWNVIPGFLFLGVFGWSAGVLPAIVDATIIVNSVMHNTLWVPGHFHFYLLLGVIPMFIGFAMYLASVRHAVSYSINRFCYWLFCIGSLGIIFTFLYSGAVSIPRRYAEYISQWSIYAQLGGYAAILVIVATTIFAISIYKANSQNKS